MKQESTIMEILAEENTRISNALKSIGYRSIKVDITQIANAEQGNIDIHIWARTEMEKEQDIPFGTELPDPRLYND